MHEPDATAHKDKSDKPVKITQTRIINGVEEPEHGPQEKGKKKKKDDDQEVISNARSKP